MRPISPVILLFAASLTSLLFALKSPASTPDFRIRLLNGGEFRLKEALERGPILIHFFDVCCPGCIEGLPAVNAAAETFAGKISAIAISTDTPKSQSKVRPFLKSKGYNLPAAIDGQMEVRKLFGGTESPLTIVVASSGEIVLRRGGTAPDDGKVLTETLEKLCRGSSGGDNSINTEKQ